MDVGLNMASAEQTTKTLPHEEETVEVPAIKVSSPVHLAQLEAEVNEAHNWRKPAGLQADGNIDGTTPGEPVEGVIWATREDIDPETFLSSVIDHKPDPTWVPEQEDLPSLDEVKQRLTEGRTLTRVETSVLLRGLLADQE
jgi:hypothetical protein